MKAKWKTLFKYSFLSGLHIRGPVFAVIFLMNLVFIITGSAGLLPLAAHITAVSLGGLGIAAMMALNIIGDIAIAGRMFASPGAYIYALTPVPRWKTLLASIITMTAMDFFTMACLIIMQVFLAFNMTGIEWRLITMAASLNNSVLFYIIWGIMMILAAYLLLVSIILFCAAAKKSFLFNLPAPGFLAVLLAFGCLYAVSLLQLFLVPFSSVDNYGIFFILTLNSQSALTMYALLLFSAGAGLFILTSKLLEKRMNI